MLCCTFTFVFLYLFLRNIVWPSCVIVFNYYIRASKNGHIKLIQNSGKWAVVTGGSDGIGREYCRQLAKLGMKILVIGRDEAKLEQTTHELKQYHKIEARYYKTDFCLPSIYDGLNEELQSLDIGVLVNNVGMTQSSPCNFDALNADFSFVSNMINCNILSAVAMSKIVVPKMIERKRGIVINICSASTLFPMPKSALYSSSKSYLVQFSRTLYHELKGSGVTVQTVLPFFVQTKFLGKFRPPRLLTPVADEYVASAIRMIGIESYTFGTPVHAIQGMIGNCVPQFIQATVSNCISTMRARALHRE